ncbi:MAG: hypothetical protein AAFX56_04245 [Pseudomonadota bacterium]
MLRYLIPLCLPALAACNNEIYVRDGVTDGDTFYLAQQALVDNDPILQAWASYSLTKSACQLELGGGNPARASSYDCELTARKHLLDTWDERQLENPALRDDYLDTLHFVRESGFLDEYVVYYFRSREWQIPAEVDVKKFRKWQRRHLAGHRASTRIIGSWNYANRIMD